jgi:hypothetical protein
MNSKTLTDRDNKTESTARSGGRILVDALRKHGTDRLFCVPGESYLDVLDALHDTPEIDTIVSKHEGAAANMAEADGKLTGRPGICFVTRGPGATHASIGVHIAFQDSTPMILFIGQVAREHRGREAFQEVDYVQMFGPLAKWVAEIDDIDRIPELVARAFNVATSGRPGPVVLALPEDVLDGSTVVADAPAYRPSASAPAPGDAEALAAALAEARQPLVIVGGANWSGQARADFAAFARAWNLPVACAFRRQDLFDNRDAQYAGHMSLGINPKLAERVRQADLVIAVGTRLGDITTDGYVHLAVPKPAQKLVHIHADANELGRVYQADLAINAGVGHAAAMLKSLPPPQDAVWAAWTASAHADYEAFTAVPAAAADYQGVDMGPVINAAGRRHPLQRRRELQRRAAPLLALPARPHATRADLRRDGLRFSCRDRGQAAAPGTGRGLPGRRRLFPDVSAGTGHRDAVRRGLHRHRRQQRHVRHDTHAPGKTLPGADQRDGDPQPGLRSAGPFVRRLRRAGGRHRGLRRRLRARPRQRQGGALGAAHRPAPDHAGGAAAAGFLVRRR